jgi:ribosomal protein L32
MIICPMCEHQQAQGTECEVCGKKLTAAAPVAVAVAPLPELEQTQLAGGRAPVQTAAIPDLEVTRQQPVQNIAVQPVPELDTGRAASAGNVMVAPIQDMDTGRALSDGLRTAAPTGPVVCRYCRNVQESGAVCDRCGMRLPKARLAQAEAAPSSGRVPAGEWTKCSKCQSNARAGRACVSCGTPIPAAE